MPPTAPTQFDDVARLLPWQAVAHERRVEFIAPPADLDFDRPFFHMTVEDQVAADAAGTLDKV